MFTRRCTYSSWRFWRNVLTLSSNHPGEHRVRQLDEQLTDRIFVAIEARVREALEHGGMQQVIEDLLLRVERHAVKLRVLGIGEVIEASALSEKPLRPRA